MTEIVAAHLERVAKLVDAQKMDEIMDAVCDGRIPTRAELKVKVRELLAAALAACAREAKLDEAKWWFQPERHIAHADGTCDCHEMAVARIAALERAVGEKAT